MWISGAIFPSDSNLITLIRRRQKRVKVTLQLAENYQNLRQLRKKKKASGIERGHVIRRGKRHFKFDRGEECQASKKYFQTCDVRHEHGVRIAK